MQLKDKILPTFTRLYANAQSIHQRKLSYDASPFIRTIIRVINCDWHLIKLCYYILCNSREHIRAA